jgi:hypothetical protein
MGMIIPSKRPLSALATLVGEKRFYAKARVYAEAWVYAAGQLNEVSLVSRAGDSG